MTEGSDGGKPRGRGARAGGKRTRAKKPPVTIDLEAAPASTRTAAGTREASETGQSSSRKQQPTGAKASSKLAKPPWAAAAAGPAAEANEPAPATTEPAVTPGDPVRPPATDTGSGGNARLVAAGAVGGGVALVLLFVLQAVGVIPAPGRDTAEQALGRGIAAQQLAAAADGRVADLEARLGDLGGRVDAMTQALDDRAEALDALGRELTALSRQVDSAATTIAAKPSAAELSQAIAGLEAKINPAGGAEASGAADAIAAMSGEIADLELKLATLAESASVSTLGPGEPGWAMAVLLLERMSRESQPFDLALDAVASFGGEAAAIDQLRPLAAAGVPSRDSLRDRFAGVAAAMTAAGGGETVGGGILAWLGDIVTVQRVGSSEQAGSDAGVGLVAEAVAAGDLAAALTERARLNQAAQQASANWAEQVEQRLAADALVAEIAASPRGETSG